MSNGLYSGIAGAIIGAMITKPLDLPIITQCGVAALCSVIVLLAIRGSK